MTVCINANLKTPYEIGSYIVSLVPPFSNLTSKTAAVHDFSLHPGPDPTLQQMSQGLILEVSTLSYKPLALLTKYGRWEILGASRGNFLDIFNNSIRGQLRLRKMCDDPNYSLSYWAIQNWNGKLLPEPRKTERNSYVSLGQAHIALQDFISDLSIISEKILPPQLYDTRSSLLNSEGPQSGLDSMNHDESHIASMWSRNDSSKMNRSDGPPNSPNLTACRIRQPKKNTPVVVFPPSSKKVSPLPPTLRKRTDTPTFVGWNPLFDSPLIMEKYRLDNNLSEPENRRSLHSEKVT